MAEKKETQTISAADVGIMPVVSAVEVYKRWLAKEAANKSAICAIFADFSVPSIEVRVANFVGQLGHELKEAAHAEAFGPPAQ